MKKYLMIGFAAVAFAACSNHDFETMSQEDYTKAQDKAKYDAAFVKAFGTPSANQDWGFGASTRAFTRAGSATIDVNGNEWASMPEVTAAEAKAVYEYVNKVKNTIPHYSETVPKNLTTYYCTQVWGGKSYGKTYYNDETKKDPNCLYLNATQKLAAAKGQNFNDNEKVFGPVNMNNLHIAMTTEDGPISVGEDGALNGYWEHMYNFNASENYNWKGNTGVKNGGTLDFAYQSSQDSKYHNKWIIIDGQYIFDDDGVRHTGKYYVCFDFIAVHPEVTTKFHGYFWNERGNNGGEWKYVGPIEVPGFYANVDDAANVEVEITLDDIKNGGTWKKTVSLVNDAADATVHNAYGIEIESYDKGNFCVEANDIYTDWIIRLVDAQPSNNITYTGRIFGEDLCATENSDFDFNDVVFDWKLYDNGKGAYIKLLAAGGTLKLKIGCDENGNGGVEVHEKFNVNTNIMVNTATDGTPKIVEKKPYPEFEISVPNADDTWTNGKDIPIYVYKSNVWQPLTAERGEPASKFNVPITTAWVDEYVDIEDAYPNFPKWVKDAGSYSTWYNNAVPRFIDLLLSNNGTVE